MEEETELQMAAASALTWMERWAVHVGNCEGGNACTCGLVAVRHELALALQPKN